MDFAYHYTDEQERFRREVADYLHAPLSSRVSGEGGGYAGSIMDWEQVHSLKQRLGAKGWLLPSPGQMGHTQGLTQPYRLVLWEELEKRGLLAMLAEAGWCLGGAIAQWGVGGQVDTFLPALGRGEFSFWRQAIDPPIGLPAVELSIKATEDGDDYILEGEALFVGMAPRPDWLWTLACIQREGVGGGDAVSFLVPARQKGISLSTPRRLVDGAVNPVEFDQVRVPRSSMLGQEGDGWSLMASSLLWEQALCHPQRADSVLEGLMRYANETARDGVTLSELPVYQQLLMEAYTNSRLLRLFRTRDAWLRDSNSAITYQEAQTRAWEKRTALRQAEIVREVMGLYSLLDSRDPRSPAGGTFEMQQRSSLAQQEQAPEVEGDASAIARHLGLGQPSQSSSVGPALSVPARAIPFV